jgi:hypothetical protein
MVEEGVCVGVSVGVWVGVCVGVGDGPAHGEHALVTVATGFPLTTDTDLYWPAYDTYHVPVPAAANIAPVNISTQGPIGQPQQIGTIYKINGNDNDYLPLFGRRKYPNDNRYEYYTIIGQFGTKIQVITKNRDYELGSNDVVFIKGRADPYRVTIYETDFPQYIPYI